MLSVWVPVLEGGPCSHCGATQASIWYGKREGHRFCKKADCMRAGGYLKPKKLSKRVRAVAAALEDEENDGEVINVDTTIIELIDIYGQRCVHAWSKVRACQMPPLKQPAIASCLPV